MEVNIFRGEREEEKKGERVWRRGGERELGRIKRKKPISDFDDQKGKGLRKK